MRLRTRWLVIVGMAGIAGVAGAQTVVDDAGSARNGKVGYWSSIVAQNGDVAISYYCEEDMGNAPPSAYTLRFAWAEGSTWQWTTVDLDGGSDTSMARGTDGLYQILYGSWNGVGWAVGGGTSWSVSYVNIPSSEAPGNISMALDAANHPHVAYMDYALGGDRALHYTYFDGSQWRTDGAGVVGTGLWTPTLGFSNTYLQLDAAGTPHIAYAQPSDAINAYGPMKYATLINGTWQSEPLGADGVDPSLAIGSDDVPQIAFNGAAGLTYAYKSAGVWQFETVVAGQRGSSVSMTLDAQNRPVLSFGLTVNEDMYLARREAAGWVVERIDGDGLSGPHEILGRYGTSLDIDEAGNTHVAYLAIDIYSTTHRCDLRYYGPGAGPPPCVTFTAPPAPASVCAGDSATFSVTASGEGTLAYEWRKDGVALADGPTAGGSVISGASTPDLTVAGVTADDAGVYACFVSADCGSATSPPAALTLNAPAAVTGAPVPVSACVGTSASFTVTATGGGLQYQWYRNAAPLSDGPTGSGSSISGSHSGTLTITGTTAADTGDYSCAVFNACGGDESPSARLTVTPCGGDCTGDLDEDHDVDLADLAILLGHFGDDGASYDDGDIDGDGDVGLSDLAILLAHFGTSC